MPMPMSWGTFFPQCPEVHLRTTGVQRSKEEKFLKEVIESNICKSGGRSWFREGIVEEGRNRRIFSCTGSWVIHFSKGQEKWGIGQQCRANKRSRAGVWGKSDKVYKESMFLYNNKKPKAARVVVYTTHGDIASPANRYLTRWGTRHRRWWRGSREHPGCKRIRAFRFHEPLTC